MSDKEKRIIAELAKIHGIEEFLLGRALSEKHFMGKPDLDMAAKHGSIVSYISLLEEITKHHAS